MPIAAAGAASLGAALLLPWAYYGGIEVRLYDVPGWPWYLTVALTQLLAVLASLLTHTRHHRTVALAVAAALGTAAVTMAAITMTISLDPAKVFGPVVPPITAVLAVGGPAALVAALAGVAAALVAWFRVRQDLTS